MEYEKAWNRHDVEGIAAYFSDDFTFEDLPMGMTANSKEDFVKILKKTFSEVPNFSMRIEQIHEGDNFVVTEWMQAGTASGEIQGGELSLKPYRVKTTSVIEFHENKIVRLSDNWDASTFYKP